MAEVPTLPVHGEVFLDSRGADRSLRVSWHRESGIVVFSLWRYEFCVGTFRLGANDVPQLLEVLSAGLDQSRVDDKEPPGPQSASGSC